MREFDKVFLEFPLCLLSFLDKRRLEMILSFCVVENSKKIKLFDKKTFSRIDEDLLPNDFDIDDLSGCIITISALQMKTKIQSIELAKQDHSLLHAYFFDYKNKYGEDAYCRIGKQILEETKRKIFNEKGFRFLCALSSILGKKSLFKRVTKDMLAVRMLGYKSKYVYEAELSKEKIISRGQMERIIKKLNEKELFTKFTFGNRVTFYSTKLSSDELRLAVMNSKISSERKEKVTSDKDYSLLIKAKIENLKKLKDAKTCTDRAHIRALNMH